MPRAPKPTIRQHRSRPYPVATSTTLHTSPHTSTSDHHAAQSWTSDSDELLMRAVQQGLCWQTIASEFFPNKTPNACRKRHERLKKKRNSADNWDGVKLELLYKDYIELREQMWKILVDRVGEKWQEVEAKCMEKGLKTLQTAGRTSRREARANPDPDCDSDEILDSRFKPFRRHSRSHQDEENRFDDSGIVLEELPLVNGNASSSFAGFTPTVTAAPQFPSDQRPQTLPSLSAVFNMQSILAVLN